MKKILLFILMLPMVANAATEISTSGTKLSVGSTSTANTLGVENNMAIGAGYVSTIAPSNGLIVQGNVGLGSTAPQQVLDVNGAILTNSYIQSTGTGDSYFSGQNVGIGTTATIYSQLAIKPATGVTGLVIGSSYAVTNNPGVSDGLVVQGNVGIGSVSPSQALVVVGTGQFTNLRIGIGTTSPTRLCISNNVVATCAP